MNTGPTGPTQGINHPTTITALKRNVTARPDEPSARMRTSEKALMLSRNIAALHENLDARPEMLEKFAGFAEKDFDIDNSKLDQLLGKMMDD